MKTSSSYAQAIDKARWSHAHGRNVLHILESDIDAARLFSYAYRSQAIGTFHATRVAIEMEEEGAAGLYIDSCIAEAGRALKQLEDKAVDLIPRDHRALISTFYCYDECVNYVVQVLEKACARRPNPKLETVRERFLDNLEQVTACDGIYTARDLHLPEQGAFVVPNLGISIVPIIYGDYHSWNAAFLSGDQCGVAVHRHLKGAEIHLGFSPLRGHTILGSGFAEVNEGYAMPIPPMTDHGFLNTSGHDHVLPFVFGSLSMSGWGIFFDVEPRPATRQLKRQPLESFAMNHSVFLERATRRAVAITGTKRQVLIPAERAGSSEVGGLELGVTRVGAGGVQLLSDHYRIVSVQSGKARIRIANAEKEISGHDHFGVPGGMKCDVTQSGDEPLVFLDCIILPIAGSGRSASPET